MTAAVGELCGICAAPLRAAARFCGRCGAEHGLMVPREAGIGPDAALARSSAVPASVHGRGLAVALVAYVVMLVPVLVLLADATSIREMRIAIEVVTGLVGVVGLAVLGRPGLSTLVPRRWRLADAALASVAIAAVLAVAHLLDRQVPWLFIELDLLLVDAHWSLATTLVHVAVIQAVTQELAYRGVILTGLRGVLSDRSAIAASAVVFAIGELSVPSMLHLTVLGAVLGWTRVRTGSVWPCILLHAGYSAATALLAA